MSASERARAQRQHLVETGFEWVVHTGESRLTVEQVVRQAGMGRNTFYSHFENSEELMRAVLQYAAQRFERASIEPGSEVPPTPTEGLHHAARNWFAAVAVETAAVKLMLTLSPAPLAASFDAALGAAIEQGRRSGLLGRGGDRVVLRCATVVGVELTKQAASEGASRDWPGLLVTLLLALLR